MVNHDWIFAGNQFKKTFNELLFTKGKWIEDRFGWFTYSANCVGERCLDVGRFEFTEEEAEFPFLGAWEFLDVGVLEAFVVGCRRVQPINIVCCQFLIVFFWFCLHAMVDIIENESFLDLRSRRQHRRRIRYSRHCGWRRRRQKLRWRTRRHCRRGGTQRRQIDLQWINTRGHVMFFFLLFCINLLTIVLFWGGGWIFTMVAMNVGVVIFIEVRSGWDPSEDVLELHVHQGTGYRNKFFDLWKFDVFFLSTYVLRRNSIQLDVFYEGIQ